MVLRQIEIQTKCFNRTAMIENVNYDLIDCMGSSQFLTNLGNPLKILFETDIAFKPNSKLLVYKARSVWLRIRVRAM